MATNIKIYTNNFTNVLEYKDIQSYRFYEDEMIIVGKADRIYNDRYYESPKTMQIEHHINKNLISGYDITTINIIK